MNNLDFVFDLGKKLALEKSKRWKNAVIESLKNGSSLVESMNNASEQHSAFEPEWYDWDEFKKQLNREPTDTEKEAFVSAYQTEYDRLIEIERDWVEQWDEYDSK